MVSDIYAKIREALEMEPTPGPWEWTEGQSIITRKWDGKEWSIAYVEWYLPGWHENRRCESLEADANAALIAACDPDTIRELLAERDRLAERVAELEKAVKQAEYCLTKDSLADAERIDDALSVIRRTARPLAEGGGDE